MTKIKLKQFDRIEIAWVDSMHTSGWRDLKRWIELEEKDGHALDHLTIGYLVLEDKDTISVCQSRLNNASDQFNVAIDAIMTIPKCAITSIKKI